MIILKNKKVSLLLLYFIIFASLYAIIVPPFESPDENLHLDYINYISKYRSLPDQYEGLEADSQYVGQGHQHPLYYIIFGIFTSVVEEDNSIDYDHPSVHNRNWKGGFKEEAGFNIFHSSQEKYLFYFIRLFSVLLGTINVYYIYKISSIFFLEEKWRLLTAFLAASLPQFQFISGMMNNDNAANLLTTLCIYFLFQILKNPSGNKNYLKLGFVLGIGIIVKKTLLFLLPGSLIIFSLIFFEKRDKNFLKNSFIFIAIVSISLLIIFARNYFTYGELLGSAMEKETMPQFVEEKTLITYYFIQPFSTGMFSSFIGVFGWMNISLPKVIHLFYLVIIFTGMMFSLISLYKEKFRNKFLLSAFMLILLSLSGVIYFNLTFTQYQGRYLFPVISMIFTVVAYGLAELQKKFHLRNIFLVILITVIVFINFYSIIFLYNHYY